MEIDDHTIDDDAAHGDSVRTRIVAAAAALIDEGGPEAATTRAVAAIAHVQAPTIYRLFGDKRGLLGAVAEYGLARYIAEKSSRPAHPDPVQDLRDGWDMHVAFGLANPGLFAIISDPLAHPQSPALAAGMDVLRRRVASIARAGRLRTSEARAISLLHAMGTGTVNTLLSQPAATRDPGLSEAAREAVIAAITGEASLPATVGPAGAATMLHACLDQTTAVSAGERHLLKELLVRIADNG
jgi:AcrR family transcriptional regulator